MKKKLAMILAAVAAGAAVAGQDNLLATFSTQGPDRYADGTVVKDGECYALVWTKTGAAFAGITVTGEAVGDQDLNRVLCIAPLAKDGRCPDVVVEVDKLVAVQWAEGGTFSLHLLDTRKADGTPDAQIEISLLKANCAEDVARLVADGAIPSAIAAGAVLAID